MRTSSVGQLHWFGKRLGAELLKPLRFCQNGVLIPFVRLQPYWFTQRFKILLQYASCQLLQFFTGWRDRYSGPVSASTQQQRLGAAFRWTVFLATLTAMTPFGSIVRAQVTPTPTPPAAVRFYINASGPLGDGSGSSPANAADASTPAKHYAINQSHTTPGTVIMYAPGTYLMNTGFWCWNGVTH
jgi:hypothetical protein